MTVQFLATYFCDLRGGGKFMCMSGSLLVLLNVLVIFDKRYHHIRAWSLVCSLVSDVCACTSEKREYHGCSASCFLQIEVRAARWGPVVSVCHSNWIWWVASGDLCLRSAKWAKQSNHTVPVYVCLCDHVCVCVCLKSAHTYIYESQFAFLLALALCRRVCVCYKGHWIYPWTKYKCHEMDDKIKKPLLY